MGKISFGIVGAGWRAQFFFKTAQELSHIFQIPIVVEPDEQRANLIKEKWKVEVVPDVELLEQYKERVDFLVLCLHPSILPKVAAQATDMGFYILVETFAVGCIEDLVKYYKRIRNPALVQISEQYWLRPMHMARLNLIEQGKIGQVTQAQISIAHGYHGISLIRKYLNVQYETCTVKAWEFKNPVIEGPGRSGYPDQERIISDKQQFSVFTFDHKWAVFDFTEEQYFSEIRGYRILIRGERGEMDHTSVRYLENYRTPVELPLLRVDSGKDGSMGVPGLTGITAGNTWVYESPFGTVRLSDDEIAIATVLKKMGAYVEGGDSFYSFAEGCQDQYLDLLLKEAIQTGKTVVSKPQIWQH